MQERFATRGPRVLHRQRYDHTRKSSHNLVFASPPVCHRRTTHCPRSTALHRRCPPSPRRPNSRLPRSPRTFPSSSQAFVHASQRTSAVGSPAPGYGLHEEEPGAPQAVVRGVQACVASPSECASWKLNSHLSQASSSDATRRRGPASLASRAGEIGRASCRERVS